MNPLISRPPFALVVATELLLAALILVGLGAIALLPNFSAEVARSLPGYAHLRAPLLSVAVAFTTLGLLALIMVGLLVQRIYRGSILTSGSLPAVDALTTVFVGAGGAVIVGSVVITIGQAGSPFLLLYPSDGVSCAGYGGVHHPGAALVAAGRRRNAR